jgi:hypothetical protein
MKIFFNGCSFTAGYELKNSEETRYSKLICDSYGAEETNIAQMGASNRTILRSTFESNLKEYDLAVIQMTFNPRTEYYSDSRKRWELVSILQNTKETLESISSSEYDNLEHPNFWKYYYQNIYSDTYGNEYEKLIQKCLLEHFQCLSIPLILLTINHITQIQNFDFVLDWKKYPTYPKGHPTELGHIQIKKQLISIIESKYPQFQKKL